MVDFKNFFQLKQNEDRLGFVNIPLNTDVELYIDPLVLSNQQGAWFIEANNLIVDFFEEVLQAIRSNDDKRALYLLGNLMKLILGYLAICQMAVVLVMNKR